MVSTNSPWMSWRTLAPVQSPTALYVTHHGKPQSPHGQQSGITLHVSSTPRHCRRGLVHSFQFFFTFCFTFFFSFFSFFSFVFSFFLTFSGLISGFQALFPDFKPYFQISGLIYHLFSFFFDFFSVFSVNFQALFFVSGLISGFQALFLIFGLCWSTGIMPGVQCPRLHCIIRPSIWFEAMGVCSKRWLRSHAFRMTCIAVLVLACLTLDLVITVLPCWSMSWPRNPTVSSKHVLSFFQLFLRLFFWLPFFLNFFFKFFFCLSFFLTFFSLFFFVAVLFFSFFCPFGRLIDFLGFRVLESTQSMSNTAWTPKETWAH